MYQNLLFNITPQFFYKSTFIKLVIKYSLHLFYKRCIQQTLFCFILIRYSFLGTILYQLHNNLLVTILMILMHDIFNVFVFKYTLFFEHCSLRHCHLLKESRIFHLFKKITYSLFTSYYVVTLTMTLCFVQRLCFVIFNKWPILFVMKELGFFLVNVWTWAKDL